MAKLSYVAVDQNGHEKSGVIDAGNADEAREKLRCKGLFPTTVSTKGKPEKKAAVHDAERRRMPDWVAGSLRQKDLTLFTRQFSTLLDSGLPLVRALVIMEQMLKPGSMRNAVLDLTDEVQAGSSLSGAMEKSPKVFDPLYCSMIRAGEASGQLGRILGRLAGFREKAEKLKKQIIGALIYPTAVLTIATLILTAIIIFIVPRFQDMFTQMEVPLPGMTILLLNMAECMTTLYFGYIPAAVLFLIILPLFGFTLLKIVRMTQKGKYYTDLLVLYIPLFGIIIKKSTISRFCRTLGELDTAGVPVLDALTIIKDAVGNSVIEEAVSDIYGAIRQGESMSEPMRRCGQFDLMTLNMVEVGEEAGEQDRMLVRIANVYDSDVDSLVSGMMSLLEPLLIIGMGLAVGFIVISLFMPLLGIINGIS